MTGREVFDRTMSLIDEADEDVSEQGTEVEHFDIDNVNDYYARTLLILNILGGELYEYSDTRKDPESPHKRFVFTPITSMDVEIDLDDYITGTVMPYGLAAHLLLDENQAAASYFNQRYEELLNKLKQGFPAESVDIYDVYATYDDYGNIRYPHNGYGRWSW